VDYTAIPPEELFVACLRTSDEGAWNEFLRRFHPLIARVVVRVAGRWGESSPQLIDDLVQETYLKLYSDRARLLPNFKSVHEDAIYGFIKVFTTNLVHDRFKVSRSQKRGGAVLTVSAENIEQVPNTEGRSQEADAIDRNLLIQEIDTCLQAVTSGPSSSRDRRIFWLYYHVGLPARAIAALPTIGLGTKGVESTVLRLTRQVRQHLAVRKEDASLPGRSAKGVRRAESL
jgi:RNA polymerase sigma-70 factor (ECF subfamily)